MTNFPSGASLNVTPRPAPEYPTPIVVEFSDKVKSAGFLFDKTGQTLTIEGTQSVNVEVPGVKNRYCKDFVVKLDGRDASLSGGQTEGGFRWTVKDLGSGDLMQVTVPFDEDRNRLVIKVGEELVIGTKRLGQVHSVCAIDGAKRWDEGYGEHWTKVKLPCPGLPR